MQHHHPHYAKMLWREDPHYTQKCVHPIYTFHHGFAAGRKKGWANVARAGNKRSVRRSYRTGSPMTLAREGGIRRILRPLNVENLPPSLWSGQHRGPERSGSGDTPSRIRHCLIGDVAGREAVLCGRRQRRYAETEAYRHFAPKVWPRWLRWVQPHALWAMRQRQPPRTS